MTNGRDNFVDKHRTKASDAGHSPVGIELGFKKTE